MQMRYVELIIWNCRKESEQLLLEEEVPGAVAVALMGLIETGNSL